MYFFWFILEDVSCHLVSSPPLIQLCCHFPLCCYCQICYFPIYYKPGRTITYLPLIEIALKLVTEEEKKYEFIFFCNYINYISSLLLFSWGLAILSEVPIFIPRSCYHKLYFVWMSSFFLLFKDSSVGYNICYGLHMLLHAWNIYHKEVEAGTSWVPGQPGYILRNPFTRRNITLKTIEKRKRREMRRRGNSLCGKVLTLSGLFPHSFYYFGEKSAAPHTVFCWDQSEPCKKLLLIQQHWLLGCEDSIL